MTRRFTVDSLQRQVSALLQAWGMDAERADRTAHIVVDADARGIDSHGVAMMTTYEPLVRSGEIRPAALPRVTHDRGASTVVDARGGLGHPVADDAIRMASGRARELGCAVAVVRGSHHFGAAGYYVRTAAEQGLVALATTSARTPALTPTGGSTRMLGTNPLAFAAPAARNPPFVLDMSTTVVAINKVRAHALRGEPLPAPWVTGADGHPILDAQAAFDALWTGAAGLTPLGGGSPLTGGHKGYGLSVMVQILSAALGGAGLPGAAGPHDIGHFFLVLDPEFTGSRAATEAYVDDLTDLLRATPPLDTEVPVQVAGDPEETRLRDRSVHGIPLPDALLDGLLDACAAWDVPALVAATR